MKKRAPKSKTAKRPARTPTPRARPLDEPEVHDRLAATGFPPPEPLVNEPFERPSAPALPETVEIGSVPHAGSGNREAIDG